ncbi:MAG: TonB-dependent receptor [Candidatus Cyclobacteriaceae bacterium M2_1C_046]
MRIFIIYLLFLMPIAVFSQNSHTIKGRVTDVNGEGLAYAAVQAAGTGTTTDGNGNFVLEIPEGKIQLTVKSIGYIPKEVSVKVPMVKPLYITVKEDVQQLNEIVVTATRTSRSIDNIPVPVDVVNAEQIEAIGALRLDEVLQEQTGLQIVSDHGSGLQMQGLSSEYILILIDGEPVIGRTAGTLELSRLAVDNIERVEIIKGPSSSLYGSEAMAGVVNIITKDSEQGFSSVFRTRYRTFGTSDVSTTLNYGNKKLKTSFFANRLSSQGYDLTPETLSMTAPPYQAYTVNPKVSYQFSDAVKLSVNSRFYTESQRNTTDIIQGNETIRLNDTGKREDWNLMPTLEIDLNDRHHVQLRSYTTGYRTETDLRYENSGEIFEENYFDQLFNRSEAVYDYYINDRHITTAGVGHTIETVEATRYDDVNAFRATYGFLQHQFIPAEKFNLIIGGRFDTHSEYASRFSPKLAAGYTVNKWLKVQASFGGGYKAPDFRQLLLNFTNPIAGYSVIGSSIVLERMNELQDQGQIERILIDPATIETIEAETSIAYNGGLHLNPGRFRGEINFFRNEISNLIDAVPIARKTNGQNVFSYFNFDEVVTQGVEVKTSYPLLKNLEVSLGYQYLDSRNLEDIERLREGKVFRRDQATNRTVAVDLADYGGLPNRSRHSGNAKLFYSNTKHGFDAALRAIYRGRWGLGDSNGNGVIDTDNEFADGYILLNLALNKDILGWLTLEAGGNNLLNNTNPFEPSLPGRIWYGGVNIKFSKN